MKEFVTFMFSPEMRGQLRHLLSAVGAVVAAKGYTTSSYWELGLGLGFAVLAMYDSWKTKKK